MGRVQHLLISIKPMRNSLTPAATACCSGAVCRLLSSLSADEAQRRAALQLRHIN